MHLWVLLTAFLSACGGGGDGGMPVPSSALSYCGVTTGSGRIEGTVTLVHDGDTITVNEQSIRLNSIDAPELSQAWGIQSRDHLAALVLNQRVTVTYAKKDQYERVVGTVFKPDCTNVSLKQLSSGAAWYYEAYQCDIEIRLRLAYASAQVSARAASRGLWGLRGEPALAPWIYRNGVDAKAPASCPNGDAASD
jgi:endonuclease YncB( thermonuclease family)